MVLLPTQSSADLLQMDTRCLIQSLRRSEERIITAYAEIEEDQIERRIAFDWAIVWGTELGLDDYEVQLAIKLL